MNRKSYKLRVLNNVKIRTLNQFVKTDPLAVEHIIICFQRISRQPELRTSI